MSEQSRVGDRGDNNVRLGVNIIFSHHCQYWLIGLAFLFAVLLKMTLAVTDTVPFNADEAVVALMARHILQGERPTFFYGQAYMGSLDAWLTALGFAIFGIHVWVIRAVQGVIYIFILVTSYWMGKLVNRDGRVGLITLWLLVIPTINLVLYTTASLGGYGEALLIGNLLLIVGFLIVNDRDKKQRTPIWKWVLFGLLAGFGLWAFGLTLVFTIPMGSFIIWRILSDRNTKDRLDAQDWQYYLRSIFLVAIGAMIGALPWWLYVIREGLNTPLVELGGSAISGVEGLSWLAQVGQHLINLLLLGSTAIIGIRPPWSINWLVLPLIPLILAFWVMVIFHVVNRLRNGHWKKSNLIVLVGVILTNILGFIIFPFGADPSGRYFLPMVVPMALLAADMILAWRIRFGVISYLAVVLLLAYNLIGTLQMAMKNPPGITTQFNAVSQIDHRRLPDLIAFLDAKGESRGYTNYWVSYPLAFLSQESLIYVPGLPYHEDFRYTSRDDRYPAYRDIVNKAEKIAYITTKHPTLEQHLRDQFRLHGITWQEQRIGDYLVFYSLSEPIKVEEIGIWKSIPQ